MSKKLRFFSDLLARAVNEIEYKNVLKKLNKKYIKFKADNKQIDSYYRTFWIKNQCV